MKTIHSPGRRDRLPKVGETKQSFPKTGKNSFPTRLFTWQAVWSDSPPSSRITPEQWPSTQQTRSGKKIVLNHLLQAESVTFAIYRNRPSQSLLPEQHCSPSSQGPVSNSAQFPKHLSWSSQQVKNLEKKIAKWKWIRKNLTVQCRRQAVLCIYEINLLLQSLRKKKSTHY